MTLPVLARGFAGAVWSKGDSSGALVPADAFRGPQKQTARTSNAVRIRTRTQTLSG